LLTYLTESDTYFFKMYLGGITQDMPTSN
jgi:hypothetical protein